MAENKGDPVKTGERIQDDTDVEKLRKESRHEGEDAQRRDVADEDVGQERIMQKGLVGSRPDESNEGSRREAPSEGGERKR